MKTIKIKTPYWGAGSKYGWTKMGYDQAGVGLKKDDILGNEELIVETRGKRYRLDTSKARAFIRYYGSKESRKGVTLGVISMSILEPYGDSEQVIEA